MRQCIVMVVLSLVVVSSSVKASIQGDINALGVNGGTVIIPAAGEVISATITVPSNITLMGACANATITAANNLNGNVIRNADQTNGNSDIRLVGFSINGNKSYQTNGNGIDLKKVSNVVIEDVKVRNCYSCGIYFDINVTDARVESCIIYSNGVSYGNGIQATSTGLSNLLISNCNIYSNKNSGIYVGGGGATIKMIGNYVYGHDSGDDGIKVYNASNVIVSANVVDGAYNGGIELSTTSDSIVTSNCVMNADNGIDMRISSGYVVNGNVAIDNNIGVFSYSDIGRSGAIVSNNVCMDNDTDGIYSYNMRDSIFSANACINNGTASGYCYGMYIKGASGTSVANVMVNANECIDTRTSGTNYEKYGVWLEYIDKSMVSDGIFRGSNTSNLYQGAGVTNLNTNNNVTN